MKPNKLRARIMLNRWSCLVVLLQALVFALPAAATTYTDNFTGANSILNWKPLNDACLTAGDGTGSIPACSSVKWMNGQSYTIPAGETVAGQGALLLTPSSDNQTGAIISNFTFPTNQGLQVTFTTYSYGGDSGGTASDGADGISFFLQDGTQPVPTEAGGLGGSLGYSCSNGNSTYDGLANAYLGLGIDEYGNFLNISDNTSSGIPNTNVSGITTYGSNTWPASGGNDYQPMRIGLRGAGNTNWAWLNSVNPSYYNNQSNDEGLVQTACQNGRYVSGGAGTWRNPYTYTTIPYNYNVIAGGYAVLPNSQPIADESASTLSAAFPITYKLTISPSGLLNFFYSYNNGAFQPVLANHQITDDNGPLPALFRFGFSAGTGGSRNVHEITCFQASPTQSNSSAGANTIQSGQFRTDSQIYLAYFTSDNWYGGLESDPLVVSGGTLQASTVANWDASCVLTGGACPTMGTDASGNALHSITAESPSARQLLTWSGSAGIPFEWSSLSTSEQSILNSTDSNGANRLAWLRGTRSDEQLQSPPGTLRARNGVLGDIINSSPTFVGAPVAGTYPDTFNDDLYGGTAPETAYSSYVSSEATRENVVYVGANDGFLHGFRSGSYSSTGTYDSSTNDGNEVLGFMPGGLLATGSNIDALTSPTYGHDYYVDATPGVGDLFYGGAWHTWLVGGLGYGGAEIYALDITNPGNFSEANAASLVIGDWTNQSTGLSHLGDTVGTPVITRLHNGDWAVIFGNGLNSGTSAGVYIGLVNPSTGAVTFKFLDTLVGSASSPNGIAYVTTADLDGDKITDYLYAGDQQGNVWRFDLTSNDPSNWSVSEFGYGSPTPLFVAKNASGAVQPITTAIAVAAIKTGTVYRVMLYFGTGQEIPQTSSAPNTYASGTQTFYGIWDWDMTAFDGMSSSAGPSGQYADLPEPQSISRSTLLQQVVDTTTSAPSNSTGQVLSYRTISSTKVICWDGSTTCASGNTQFGFYFDFPGAQEQIIYNPTIQGSAVVVNTAIPPVISASQCAVGQQTGYTMAFSLGSGGGLPTSFFPNQNGSLAPTSDGSTVAGIQVNGVGSLTTVQYGSDTYIVTQTTNNTPVVQKINNVSGASPARVSWREIQ